MRPQAAKAARKAAKREAKAAKQAAKARKAEDKQAAKRAKAAEQAAAKAAGKADAKAAKAARKAAKADAKAAKAARKAAKADRRAASEAEPSIDQQQATDAQVGAGVAEAIEAAEVVEAAAPDPTPTAATESLAEAAALVRRTREPAASRIVDRVDARPRRTRRTSVTPPGPVEVPSVESTPEPAPEPTPDLFEPDAQVEPEPEPEPEPEAQAEPEPEAGRAEAEPSASRRPKPKQSRAGSRSRAGAAQAEPEPEAQAEPEPETKPSPKPEPSPSRKPEPEPEPEPSRSPKPEPEPEGRARARAPSRARAEPGARGARTDEAQAEPWAQVEPERDAQPLEPESPEPGAAEAAETVGVVESGWRGRRARSWRADSATGPSPSPSRRRRSMRTMPRAQQPSSHLLRPSPSPSRRPLSPSRLPRRTKRWRLRSSRPSATEADTAEAAPEATAQVPLVVEAVESVAIEADTAAAEPEADTVEAEPAGPLAVDATSAVESAVIGASIDIGANSIHLLVAAVAGHRIEPLLDESVFLGLGDRVARDGKIGPEARRDVVNALASYAATASRLGARELTIVGTEPIRRAFDATALVGEAEARADIALHVLDHDEEAMLTLLGVTRGRRVRNELLVVDIGGGSCEFVIAGPDRPVRSVGLSLGSARLTQDHIHSDPPTPAEVDALREIVRATLIDAPEANPQELVAVGGTASNLLRLLPATAIDRVLTRRRIAVALAMLTVERSVEAAERHALRPQRARILPAGRGHRGRDPRALRRRPAPGLGGGDPRGRRARRGHRRTVVARPVAVPGRGLGPAAGPGLTA